MLVEEMVPQLHHDLEEKYIDSCVVCGGTGYRDDESRCECFLRYVYHVTCRYSGFDDVVIAQAFDVTFPHNLPIVPLVKRKLAFVLIGTEEQAEVFMCRQIWENLN